jgi:hypothetical protein
LCVVAMRPPAVKSAEPSAPPTDADAGALFSTPSAVSPPTREAVAPVKAAPFVDASATDAATIADPLAITLYGVVRKSDGKSAAGPKLTFLDDRCGPAQYAQSGADGGYLITGLIPGRFDVRISGDGVTPRRTVVDVAPGAPRRRVDFTVDAATRIKIKAKFTGEDATSGRAFDRGCSAVASRERPKAPPPSELRSYGAFGIGRFREAYDASPAERAQGLVGTLDVDGPLPYWIALIARSSVIDARLITTPTDEVEFVVSPEQYKAALSTVRARFVDPTGAPVPGVRASLSDRQSGGGRSVVSDEQGVAVLEGVAPGLLHLQAVLGDGKSRLVRRVLIPSEPEVALGPFRISPVAKITGRILGPPATVARAQLSFAVFDDVAAGLPFETGTSYAVGRDGVFSIEAAPREKLLLRAVAPGGAQVVRLIDVGGGDVLDVELRFETGTPVRLEPEFGERGAYRLTITDGGGLPCVSTAINGDWPVRIQLAPGAYTAHVFVGDAPPRSIPFSVGAAPMRLPIAP